MDNKQIDKFAGKSRRNHLAKLRVFIILLPPHLPAADGFNTFCFVCTCGNQMTYIIQFLLYSLLNLI